VIVASQVEHAMQYQDFDFVDYAVAQPRCILAGDFKTDGDVASPMAGKREHIRGFVFVAKAPVQRLHLSPRGNQDCNFTFHTRHGLGTPRETLQSDRINAIRFSIEDDHKF
jgi:hypothetical protein